jgi:hypothetical protein
MSAPRRESRRATKTPRKVNPSTTKKKTKRQETPIDLNVIGASLAKLLDVKRRLLQVAFRTDDLMFACAIILDVCNVLRVAREDLEQQLRDHELKHMSPEKAQQAIYGLRLFEDSLRADYSEIVH